ncbi:L-ribulose-5-phosphate 4-epimerase [Cetobacterium sp. 2A]|uniref:L-ribulose-5-phosphate 4-epimerase n=1 Tax=unclassified Cetobacterium TaxID=2630983 RepID=UPI00163BFC5D|nr:L-ribulose-5-phosphate 4-epimerase [Cetobacterium sp. 2A]MBC2857297.1 L-ribulose-5-phosphate 4-epimerase [Cetobacterium sp. 2A]
MLEELKKEVLEANLELNNRKLVTYTWGNVSGIDRELGLVVIKASGIRYEDMTLEHMVVVDLDGNILEGKYNPSSDTPTHLEIYKKYLNLGGIVHTHSTYATGWAQACRDIPVFGTTHADYFYGSVPCTRVLSEDEIEGNYEKETGKVIIETLITREINPLEVPGITVASHGPFTWGESPKKAVHNAVVLEEIAKMAYLTNSINPNIRQVSKALENKHYSRKHGKDSYYGQKNEVES